MNYNPEMNIMKTYKIHLIRHGYTQDNLDGKYSGRNESTLCQQGRQQLLELKQDYDYPKADFLFTSPMKRCLETAEILYPELKPLIIEDLAEYDFGEFEGKTAEELSSKDELFAQWLSGNQEVRPPFGESNTDFVSRICRCFMKIVDGVIKADAQHVALITHGGVISVLLANFGLPEATSTQWLTPSGCGYTILITPSIWMSARKTEVLREIPEEKNQGNYYDGWDYYPDTDGDFQ